MAVAVDRWAPPPTFTTMTSWGMIEGGSTGILGVNLVLETRVDQSGRRGEREKGGEKHPVSMDGWRLGRVVCAAFVLTAKALRIRWDQC